MLEAGVQFWLTDTRAIFLCNLYFHQWAQNQQPWTRANCLRCYRSSLWVLTRCPRNCSWADCPRYQPHLHSLMWHAGHGDSQDWFFFKCFSYILSFFYAFFNTEAHLDGAFIHSLKSKLLDVTLKRVSPLTFSMGTFQIHQNLKLFPAPN